MPGMTPPLTALPITPAAPPAATTSTPVQIADNRPPHTHTESTLAPTSEFMRYFLAAYPARYVFRGLYGVLFDEEKAVAPGIRNRITAALQKPGQWLHQMFGKGPGEQLSGTQAAFYNASLGLGSLALTLSYSWTVYKDIKNLYCEAVGAEFNKRPEDVNYADFRRSQNRVVKITMDNFWNKLSGRLATDALFVPATLMRKSSWGDFMLGFKGVQLFAGTWKRKTTLFEDLVSFVTNKINPRNGLGQPIAVGEVFDLYQHYADQFHPEKQFSNVLEHGTGEGARWAKAQPIFLRITELMNKTYAYKHATILNADGHAIKQADFTLPKFIYLLGHDLIDTDQAERTLTTIEIANQFGIDGVKQMQAMLTQGASLEQIHQALPYKLPEMPKAKPDPGDEKNGVIAKGSTLQLDDEGKNRVIAKGSTLQLDGVPVPQLQTATVSHEASSRTAGLLQTSLT